MTGGSLTAWVTTAAAETKVIQPPRVKHTVITNLVIDLSLHAAVISLNPMGEEGDVIVT